MDFFCNLGADGSDTMMYGPKLLFVILYYCVLQKENTYFFKHTLLQNIHAALFSSHISTGVPVYLASWTALPPRGMPTMVRLPSMAI